MFFEGVTLSRLVLWLEKTSSVMTTDFLSSHVSNMGLIMLRNWFVMLITHNGMEYKNNNNQVDCKGSEGWSVNGNNICKIILLLPSLQEEEEEWSTGTKGFVKDAWHDYSKNSSRIRTCVIDKKTLVRIQGKWKWMRSRLLLFWENKGLRMWQQWQDM